MRGDKRVYSNPTSIDRYIHFAPSSKRAVQMYYCILRQAGFIHHCTECKNYHTCGYRSRSKEMLTRCSSYSEK